MSTDTNGFSSSHHRRSAPAGFRVVGANELLHNHVHEPKLQYCVLTRRRGEREVRQRLESNSLQSDEIRAP